MTVRQLSWSRALCISALIHCFLLSALGLIAGNFFAANAGQPPRLIEVELLSGPAGSGGAGRGGQPPAGRPEPVAETQRQPVEQIQPVVPSQPEESKPVIAAKPPADSHVPAMAAVPGPGDAIRSGGWGGDGLGTGNGRGAGAGDGSGIGSVTGEGSGAGAGIRAGPLLPPAILKKVDPQYPREARQQGIEGTVRLKIEVLESGYPGEVQIDRSAGSDLLDQAALDAVRRWRFVPAREGNKGAPVRCYTTVPIVFRLK